MKNVSITEEEITHILDIVVAILNLGNVIFQEQDDDSLLPTANSNYHISEAAALMQVDEKELLKSLVTKEQKFGREIIVGPRKLEDAYQERDSLCKHIYGEAF